MKLPTQLGWRRANDAPGRWQLLDPAPTPNSGFVEATQYLFEKPGPGWSFRVDDEPIADGPDPKQWLWSPRFFAGEVMGELVGHGTRTLFAIDVSPDPAKVGRDMFGRMVEELWAANPALVIGHEPATRQIGALGRHEDPWLEFSRFRRYVPDFLQAMGMIRARPRRSLRALRTLRPLHQVRRVDRRTAAALSTSPMAAVLTGIAEGSPRAEGYLDAPLVEETLDSAANRALLALTVALIRRGRALQERLQAAVQRDVGSEAETPLASRWPVRRTLLLELVAGIQGLLRHTPFPEVRRAEITAAGLTAIAADPSYSRAWNRGWRALRHGVDAPPTEERLWMSPSWQIYERWCFLVLGRHFARVAPRWDWKLDVAEFRWTGEHSGSRAVLDYMPTFRSMAPDQAGRWSVSRQREPDLALTVMSADPGSRRFVVFDAKYRASRANVLDAMTSAHVYQDSLRLGDQRPVASFLLVPSGGGAAWLEQEVFHAEHRVGVVAFASDTLPTLPSAVALLLSDSAHNDP
jgi:hypothetical protein